MPSARLRQSASDPFARLPADATPFSAAYAAGAIPCRIYHGSVKHSLTWTTPPELLPTFDPLLVQCAGGLRETQYPHHFVACQAFSEMLQSPGGHPPRRAATALFPMPLSHEADGVTPDCPRRLLPRPLRPVNIGAAIPGMPYTAHVIST